MNKSPHFNQQTGTASLKLRNYVFTKTWKLTITASISENK